MSDKKLNMRAYYHTFESTGEMGADRILSAVASAGKSAHHTADWDEEWKNIQSAAVETAGEIAELKQRLAAAEAKNTELEKELFVLSSDVIYCGCGHVTSGLQEKAKRIYGKLRESGGVG